MDYYDLIIVGAGPAESTWPTPSKTAAKKC